MRGASSNGDTPPGATMRVLSEVELGGMQATSQTQQASISTSRRDIGVGRTANGGAA
jgi:hypothetical protein